MEHNVSSKKKIKNIVDEITNILNIDTQCYIETYVNVYPKENCMNDIDNNSFFGYKLGFLQDKKGITNDLLFKRGIIGAALSFYESANIAISEQNVIHDISSGIYVCRLLDKQTNVFILNIHEDFKMLYEDCYEYFEYLLGKADDNIANEFITDFEAIFAYYFSANNTHCESIKKNVIVLSNTAFKYRGIDFSIAAKEYLLKNLKRTLKNIGFSLCGSEVEVVPYDLYFNSLRPGLAVDYFINKLSNAYEQYNTNINNIGSAMDIYKNELITLFAFASNNYVGTHYCNDKITSLKYKYEHFPKPIIIEKPIYADVTLQPLFLYLSKTASVNINIIKNEDVLQPLFTSEWLYENIGNIKGFDNTFICFGYLKAVETLLTTVLLKYYKGHVLQISANNEIVISEDTSKYLNVGNMMRFLIKNTNLFDVKKEYGNLIKKRFNLWRAQIRNGYFHKDSIKDIEVTRIRNITLEVIYMILGIIPQ